ncbi:MAG: serine/threonine protein kinase, partial [Rivularia sp. ALOHA_DT_140]|nr:serine/threonine protein kinase [Rivularia sp. ALOHA_DT_140]
MRNAIYFAFFHEVDSTNIAKLSIQVESFIMTKIMVERYRLLELLNGTPAGRSYLGKDTDEAGFSQCVIKQFLPPSTDIKLLKVSYNVLDTEAKPLQNLAEQDDRIQNLITFFVKNKNFYLVRKYIEGNPLNKEIVSREELGSEQVIKILTEVLELLVIIHSHGIIHRNLKPANIIRRKSDNKLILTDFGALQEAVSNVVGYSAYTPIEQNHGNAQFNSDIYTLGIIAIEALTGLTASDITTQKNIKNTSAEKIIWHPHNYKVNKKLAKIIDKMVHLNYQNRYQSATEVLQDLQNINQPKSNLVYQQFKLCQQTLSKNPKLFVGIGSLILVGAVGWYFFTYKDINYART